MTPAIGFVGLGIMGKPMARNLMKAGYSLTIYNRSRRSMDELAAEGAELAGSSMEVAERTEIFIAMVPDSPDSEDVIIGPKGALKGAKAGSVIIDRSSIAPLTAQKLAADRGDHLVIVLPRRGQHSIPVVQALL